MRAIESEIYLPIVLSILVLFLADCTRESYETRLIIQNNLHKPVNCILYPKAGSHIEGETKFIISGDRGMEIIYRNSGTYNPIHLVGSAFDSILMTIQNTEATKLLVLRFNPLYVSDYRCNLFTDPLSWKCANEVLNNYNPPNSPLNLRPQKLYLQVCTFEIIQDSILSAGK